jgi:hypothetical protein
MRSTTTPDNSHFFYPDTSARCQLLNDFSSDTVSKGRLIKILTSR